MDFSISSLAVPPIAFLIFTVLAYVLFWIGKQMAPPPNDVGGKLEPYLCGQNWELGNLVPGYWQFFAIAILFTVLHVTAFMIALMPSPAILFTLAYMGIVAAAVGVLIGEVRLTIPPRDKAMAKLQTRVEVIDASTGTPVGSGGSTHALD